MCPIKDYIENQGFKEQKVTSGIELEHVYSKNIKAIKVIYTMKVLCPLNRNSNKHRTYSNEDTNTLQ